MNIDQRMAIEAKILSIANQLVKEWGSRLNEQRITVDPLRIYSSGSSEDYFSEIEFNFWRDDELLEIFSITLYMDGKQILSIEDAANHMNDEISTVTKSYVSV